MGQGQGSIIEIQLYDDGDLIHFKFTFKFILITLLYNFKLVT